MFAVRPLMLAAAALATACAARSATPDLPISWTLSADEAQLTRGKIHLGFEVRRSGNSRTSHERDFPLSSFSGLSPEILRSGASRDVAFRYAQPAGTLICYGVVKARAGAGQCHLESDPRFVDELARRGIGRPDNLQLFNLTLSGVDLAVVDELARHGYPKPDIEGLVGLGIFNVTPTYVRDLAASGYRLASVGDLVQFKIFDVTPAYIREMERLGYARLPAKQLVEFKIFKVSPEFVRDLRALGYRNVTPRELVQLKIFNVTPEYIRGLEAAGIARPDLEQVRRMRMAGVDPSRRRRER